MSPLVLAVGAQVRWTSTGRGVARHHVGVVVAAVPGGALPVPPPGRWVLRYRGALPRLAPSYLVAVADGAASRAGLLHWPRVAHLQPYAAPVRVSPVTLALDAGAALEAAQEALKLRAVPPPWTVHLEPLERPSFRRRLAWAVGLLLLGFLAVLLAP